MLCAYKTCEIYVSVIVRFRTEKCIRFIYVRKKRMKMRIADTV